MTQSKTPASPPPSFWRYGLKWPHSILDIAIEMEMIRRGGRWKTDAGVFVGVSLFHHYKAFQTLLWPQKVWHKWSIEELECYLGFRVIGVLGPASSGKTFDAATNLLADYYVFPDCTTGLVSSTTKESLEMRVWGEIKKMHRDAKTRWNWLPGNLIEGRQRIVTDHRSEAIDGRDFRNGIVGVACRKGQTYQGLAEYVGIKNKRLRLVADELQFLPGQFCDSISNLNKNPDFKCLGLGNPKDTTDALGKICEPAAELGGWDHGADQLPGTKRWKTRFPKGVCLQLPGSDSPNLDGSLNCPLITQEKIDADIEFFGKDSLQYTMMDEGRMPRGQGNRRVITRQLCLKHGAMDPPIWKDSALIHIGFCDAAYRGVGGDRSVFGHLCFGKDPSSKTLLHLVETMVIPIVDTSNDSPEDQIALFCQNQCTQRNIPEQNFGFDSTGRGSLVSSCARLWSGLVVPIEFGGPPSDRKVSNDLDVYCNDHYFNFVTELWYTSRYIIEAGQFRGMTEEVMDEGSKREWGFAGKNKIQVEPKDMMKLKTGRSPDLYDALVVGIELARRRGFLIEKLSRATTVDSHKWKRELETRAKKLAQSGQLTYKN
jgi:hypothetical protein